MDKASTAILLIDHQDMTVNWIQSQPKAMVIANVRMLARMGTELGIPLLVTSTMEEQIGTNIRDVQETAPQAYAARVKRGGTLNCFLDPKFRAAVKALNRKKLVLAGLTTDICLYHTVSGALREGYEVQVVADASGSMSAMSDTLSFDRMRAQGAVITVANQVLTELFTDFGTPDGQKAMKINLEEVVSKLGK
ncbi:MAG: Nicotinamidase family protein YcaC [Hyphomicrobiales bacterium]|nr:Nicotinamidase family protein YcaC [Hyphomicrobiales bacterium]